MPLLIFPIGNLTSAVIFVGGTNGKYLIEISEKYLFIFN